MKATCGSCVEENCHVKLLSCSLKNSKKAKSVPISDVPTAKREKASTIIETPLHFTLNKEGTSVLGLFDVIDKFKLRLIQRRS